MFNSNEPLGAYQILEKLKKKRDNAEPPTVYRVLAWLVETKIIHRIETQNAYVICSSRKHNIENHHTILMLCKNCLKSYEIEDQAFLKSMENFAKKYCVMMSMFTLSHIFPSANNIIK